MNIKEIIGKNVRAKREVLGITQEELSFRTNLHRTYITSIERGQRNVSAVNLEILANALNCSIADLFAHEEDGHARE